MLLVLLILLSSIDMLIGRPLLYIYDDMPINLKDTWPPNNLNRTVNHSIYHKSFRENNGFGRLLDSSSGTFNSWQFSVFKMIYIRLLTSPYRTENPELASLFFIPYDGGVDALVSAYDGRLLKNKCPRSGIAKSFLRDQKYFLRNKGRDHFLVFGVIQGVASLNSPGCRSLYMDECALCTKLTIEVSYHNQTQAQAQAQAQVTAAITDKRKPRRSAFKYDPTWVSIPYPSSFHYWEKSVVMPWEVSAEAHIRDKGVTFVGGGKTINSASKALRERLKVICSRHQECNWINTGRQRAMVNLTDALNLYRRSVFCLSPPGDSPTRKGIFDVLLAGCIPVVFDKYTLADQYPWHVGPKYLNNISLYFPIEFIFGSGKASRSLRKLNSSSDIINKISSGSKKLDFIDILLGFPPSKIKDMQNAIGLIGWNLQYSMPPESILTSKNVLQRWSPPKPDGVDIILKNLFENAANAAKDLLPVSSKL